MPPPPERVAVPAAGTLGAVWLAVGGGLYVLVFSRRARVADAAAEALDALAAFLDGLFEEAAGQTQIVDGFEFSYPYRSSGEFERGYWRMVEAGRRLSTVPEVYAARLSVDALADEFADVVVAVNVGNEALVDWNDHMVPLDRVIAYVRRVKAAIEQPVTVADDYNFWNKPQAQQVADELDFICLARFDPVGNGNNIFIVNSKKHVILVDLCSTKEYNNR